MGASGWDYFVPYQADIGQALQELRQRAFEAGKYYKAEEFYDDILDFQPEDLQERLGDEFEKLKSPPEPKSMDELIALNGEAGTHSIIDIEAISDGPGFGVAWPLTSEQLVELFGTDQPTHEVVAAWDWGSAITHLRSRWEGLYVVVYKDGLPNEIFFCGFSGD